MPKIEELVLATRRALGEFWQVPNASVYDPLVAFEENAHPGVYAHPAALRINKSARRIEIVACGPVAEICLSALGAQAPGRGLILSERQGPPGRFWRLGKKP
jgi:hypothetical protein